MTTVNLTDDQINTIDAAIAKAKARKATGDGTPTSKPRVTNEEKQAAKAAKQAAKEAAKVSKAVEKAAKKAEREAKKATKANVLPGTARLASAEARLPTLSESASETLADIFRHNPGTEDLVSIIAHLQHSLRSRQTVAAALGTNVKEGQTVTLIAGEPRFVGKTGVVTKVSRIRCHVQLEGREKPIYVFTSDVEVLAENQVEATGTDG